MPSKDKKTHSEKLLQNESKEIGVSIETNTDIDPKIIEDLRKSQREAVRRILQNVADAETLEHHTNHEKHRNHEKFTLAKE